MMAVLRKAESLITRFLEVLCAALTLIIMCLMFYQTILRYVAGTALFWIEELSRNGLMALTFMGSVLCIRTHSHTRIEYFVEHLPGKLSIALQIVADIGCGIFSGFLCYYSIFVVKSGMKVVFASIPIAKGIVYAVIPVCTLMMAVLFLAEAVLKAGQWRSAGEEAEEK